MRDSEKTLVVFRKWRSGFNKGEAIALFPEIVSTPGLCSSYEHIGQHSGADYHHVIAKTTPATEECYRELKAELETIGYRLVVRKRFSQPRS